MKQLFIYNSTHNKTYECTGHTHRLTNGHADEQTDEQTNISPSNKKHTNKLKQSSPPKRIDKHTDGQTYLLTYR